MSRVVELAPAIAAAGGGAAAFTGIAIHERRLAARARADRQTFAMVFPVATAAEAAAAALHSLSGLDARAELVLEITGDEHGIHHLLHVSKSVAPSVADHLAAGMPGIRLDLVESRRTGDVTAAARLVVPHEALLRTDDAVESSRSLLAGLAGLRSGERVSLRWALRPGHAPRPNLPQDRRGGPRSLHVWAEQRALRARFNEPGFNCVGLVLARASHANRARALVSDVATVMRSRRGAGKGLVIRRGSVRAQTVMPTVGRGRGWLTTSELIPLLGWPLGSEVLPGVELGAARRIPVPRGIPREGRRLFIGSDPYGERPVALSTEATRHHMAIVGPSGSGKSVLLQRTILDDLSHGFGGVVIDPRADLVTDLLDRVTARDANRIVVLDPGAGGLVPGLDVFGVGDPDLRADVLLGALGAIFKDSWGPRTDVYLRLGLRTLSELPHPALTDWLRLFTDAGFRRRAVSRLRDPLLIGAWQTYEALSPQEQNQHVAAPMSKVMSLLSRPAVRSVLAQRQPKLDIGRLLAERKWLFVNLAPGTLGEPAARLLGAILTYAVWTAVEARATLPPSRRTPVSLVLDELQTISSLPFGLEYLFERARGLGCGVTVATQALGRLPDSLRQSLLGNVATLVTFRLGYDEASRVSRELPGLGAADIQALRKFEVAARIGTGSGSGVAVVTGHTEPPPERTGQAGRIRRQSAERYGQKVAAIDDELRGESDDDVDPQGIGRVRRSS